MTTQRGSRPVRFELIDRGGRVISEYLSAQAAAGAAQMLWPDQEQDPDRTGRGWDIQVVGS